MYNIISAFVPDSLTRGLISFYEISNLHFNQSYFGVFLLHVMNIIYITTLYSIRYITYDIYKKRKNVWMPFAFKMAMSLYVRSQIMMTNKHYYLFDVIAFGVSNMNSVNVNWVIVLFIIYVCILDACKWNKDFKNYLNATIYSCFKRKRTWSVILNGVAVNESVLLTYRVEQCECEWNGSGAVTLWKNACSVGLEKNLFKCYWSHFMIEAFRGYNRFNKKFDFSLTFLNESQHFNNLCSMTNIFHTNHCSIWWCSIAHE